LGRRWWGLAGGLLASGWREQPASRATVRVTKGGRSLVVAGAMRTI